MISCLKDRRGGCECFSSLATNTLLPIIFQGTPECIFLPSRWVFDLHPFTVGGEINLEGL